MDFQNRLTPTERILDFSEQGWVVWDASPIYGPDGRLHVFFTRWTDHGDSPDAAWVRRGEIAHATAPSIDGPFEVMDVLLRGDGGCAWDASGFINPRVFRWNDRYALYYSACCKGRKDTEAIGLLTADSLDGPWHKVSETEPVIPQSADANAWDSFIVSNPAPIRGTDGRIWVYYKGRRTTDTQIIRRIGVAMASQLEGPYIKYLLNPVLDNAFGQDCEDPCVWWEDNSLHMLLHDMGTFEHGSGILFHSYDGIAWLEPEPGYPSTSQFANVKQRLESPQLLFRDGTPEYLLVNRGGSADDPRFTSFVFNVDRHANKTAGGDA